VFGTGSSGKTSVINALLGREAGNTAATIGTTTTEQEYPYESQLFTDAMS
jgi:ribosome biogenesis GTPase A